MKIIFMGTPDFACPCLEKLIKSDNEVVAVFCQPDKPVGRKQIMTPPPVKRLAQEKGIPVYQPATLKKDEVQAQIKALGADIIIVVAYGKILPKEVLECTPYGCVNVHASVLPKYRGAAPIQWAVLNGDEKTGVTVMQMNEGLDTGDMLAVSEVNIGENETSEELLDRLSVLGGELLIEVIKKLKDGTAEPVRQPEGDFGYAEKITKALSPIDWSKPARDVHNLVRGLESWPCAQTVINGKTVKIHKTVLSDKTGGAAGEVIDATDSLTVSCGDGRCVEILELQPEGKSRMQTKAYLLGNRIETGTVLGE